MNARTLARPAGAGTDLWRPRPARVTETRVELSARGGTRPVVTLRLERGRLDWRPGQFLEVGLPGAGEVPISISTPPSLADTLAITVRAAGLTSTLLTRLRTGATVGLRGPFGNGFPVERCEGRDVLFVAGGIGLAPLRGLLWELLLHRERYGRIVVLHGARTPHDLLYPWQWLDWRRTGVELLLSVDAADAAWQAEEDPPRVVGFLPSLFPRVELDPSRSLAFLCGPPVMIQIACAALAGTHGWPHDHLVATLERHMKCGVGKCGHCVVVDRYVCVDGPVFTYDELLAMDHLEPPW